MPMHPAITQDLFLKVSQVFDWATKEHYLLWFTGTRERSRRIEILLKRLTEKRKLIATDYGKKLIYIAPRYRRSINDRYQIEHGLGVTEGLVRFTLADRTGAFIPERKFKGRQVRPEWGMHYHNSILLYEFCTRDNAKRLNVLKRKLSGYQQFISELYTVLFVMQLPREQVKQVISHLKPEGPFLFTDYETFLSVPIGQQLVAPIYLWEDGNEYPLRRKPD